MTFMWMAGTVSGLPTTAGVTIRNNRYQSYEWFRHSPGNSRSLVNDQVHDVIEDSEGDLWFATSNGISLLQPAVGRWRSFLSRSDGIQDGGNHIFLTLCEVSLVSSAPAGTLRPVQDRKENREGGILSPPPLQQRGVQTSISMTSEKDSGGYYMDRGLPQSQTFRSHDGTVRLYPVRAPSPPYWRRIPEWMWIGTGMGLYLLDGHEGGTCRHIAFPVEAVHVYALYQAPDGLLYIGTGRAGLLVYDSVEDRFVRQYQTENCALISNNIHTIVPVRTAPCYWGPKTAWPCSGVSGTFRNWTAEQGLASVCLNAGVSTFRHGKASCSGVTPEPSCSPSDMRIPPRIFSDAPAEFP